MRCLYFRSQARTILCTIWRYSDIEKSKYMFATLFCTLARHPLCILQPFSNGASPYESPPQRVTTPNTTIGQSFFRINTLPIFLSLRLFFDMAPPFLKHQILEHPICELLNNAGWFLQEHLLFL